MAEDGTGNRRQVVVAMKGHPGTGKSTLAHAIASNLRCPLLDKDDLFGAASPLFNHLRSTSDPATADHLVNELSYDSLFNLITTQLRLGLSVVVDTPLSSRSRLDRLLQIAAETSPGAAVVVVECRLADEAEWRRRLERRGHEGGGMWNQPATWADVERILKRYDGCYEYPTDDVPKLVVDTTATEMAISSVMPFIWSHCKP